MVSSYSTGSRQASYIVCWMAWGECLGLAGWWTATARMGHKAGHLLLSLHSRQIVCLMTWPDVSRKAERERERERERLREKREKNERRWRLRRACGICVRRRESLAHSSFTLKKGKQRPHMQTWEGTIKTIAVADLMPIEGTHQQTRVWVHQPPWNAATLSVVVISTIGLHDTLSTSRREHPATNQWNWNIRSGESLSWLLHDQVYTSAMQTSNRSWLIGRFSQQISLVLVVQCKKSLWTITFPRASLTNLPRTVHRSAETFNAGGGCESHDPTYL